MESLDLLTQASAHSTHTLLSKVTKSLLFNDHKMFAHYLTVVLEVVNWPRPSWIPSTSTFIFVLFCSCGL